MTGEGGMTNEGRTNSSYASLTMPYSCCICMAVVAIFMADEQASSP
jgi:hypothetical protein